MFEICMDDSHSHVLAVHGTAAAALNDLDRIAEATAIQIAANGEGGVDFALRLVVRERPSGLVVVNTPYRRLCHRTSGSSASGWCVTAVDQRGRLEA